MKLYNDKTSVKPVQSSKFTLNILLTNEAINKRGVKVMCIVSH